MKNQAEVEAEFHVEEEKAAEIKEVAEMQQKCSDSVKVEVAESTRAVNNTA